MQKLIVLGLVGALAGCQTTSIDTAIQKSAPQICAAAQSIHEAFVASGAGSIKDKAREAAAWSVLVPICADPTSVTATTVAIAIAQAAVIAQLAKRSK